MKLVLVDRDGVIAEEHPGYVTTPEQLHIYPQALQALALLKQQGFTTVIITNQSVVGRGIITLDALQLIHDYLRDMVHAHGGHIADIFYCADHPDTPSYRRKPKPGMLVEALEKYGAVAEHTPFIGDALSDMQAAAALSCPRYLVMTGKGRAASQNLADDVLPVIQSPDMLDAVRKIVDKWK